MLLSAVFVVGTIVGGISLWEVLTFSAQNQITSESVAFIETMSSVRNYTSNNVAPLLADEMEQQTRFVAETVPAFSAREVFEHFRQRNEEHANFLYKEATLNPTNPRDQADAFETSIVEQMRSDASLTELSGFRSLNGQQLFYIARPLAVDTPDCLRCHSDPAIAPENLIATYGSEGGFGWELNEIVAAQIIYVPAEDVFATARGSFWRLMFIFVVIFALIILIIQFLLRRYVLQPVGTMGTLAQKICADELVLQDLESPTLATIMRRSDELGALASVFQSMACEIHSRTHNLKQQVHSLTIEIDEIKRQHEVAEIVETDYFKDLQSRARSLRQRRHAEADEAPKHTPSTSDPSSGDSP